MGDFKRIYVNAEVVNGYLSETDAKEFFNMYLVIETSLVYDENTRVVYYMPPNSKEAVPYLGKNNKKCKFIRDKIVEID